MCVAVLCSIGFTSIIEAAWRSSEEIWFLMIVRQYTRLDSIRDRALRAACRFKAIDAMTTRNDGVSVDMSRSRGRSASVPALFMAAQPRATCVPQLTRATWPIRGPPAEPAVRAETAQNNKQQSEPKQQSERKQLPIGVLSALPFAARLPKQQSEPKQPAGEHGGGGGRSSPQRN